MVTIQDYVNEIQKAEDNEWTVLKYNPNNKPSFEFNEGKRFIKVLRIYSGQTSVHCFVDKETGDIYKASGWNAPAKGIRGNINNIIKPLLSRDFYR